MKKSFYILLFSILISQLTLGVVNVILPLYFRSLQLDMTRLNLIFSLFEFGLLFSLVFIGKLSDIFGRRPVILLSLLLHSFISYSNVLATRIYQFAILRMFRSVASVVDNVISPAYIADVFKEKIGTKIGFFNFTRGLGLAVGGMIGGILFAFFGFKSAFYIVSFISFLTFCIAYIGLKEPKKIKSEGVDKKLSSELVKLAIISAIVWIGLRTLMPTIMPIYFSEVFNQPATMVGILIGIGLLIYSFSNIIGGRLSDSIGVKMTVAISLLAHSVFALLLFFSQSLIMATAFFFIYLFFDGIEHAGFSTWTIYLSRDHKKAQDIGTYRMIAGVGTIPGLIISGLIADIFGIQKVFLFASSIFFLSFVLILIMLKRVK